MTQMTHSFENSMLSIRRECQCELWLWLYECIACHISGEFITEKYLQMSKTSQLFAKFMAFLKVKIVTVLNAINNHKNSLNIF
jgi:hypothetical protein